MIYDALVSDSDDSAYDGCFGVISISFMIIDWSMMIDAGYHDSGFVMVLYQHSKFHLRRMVPMDDHAYH